MELPLTPIQVRIIGCLIEKELTTPAQYPLTVNALKQACNQKTNRYPVVNYHEGEIGHALRELEADDVVTQAWSTRAARWEHQFPKALGLINKEVAVITALMLRGPQTAAEIRSHCHRMYAFDDVDDVEYVLDRMQNREQPLVVKLPRQPGQKEQRYAHLLAGEPDIPEPTATPMAGSAKDDLIDRINQLESTVAHLMDRIDRIDGNGNHDNEEDA